MYGCVCVLLLTLGCHNTYYFLQCVCVLRCLCVPLNSSCCHSVCPLFHEAVCLLSGIRWHIIFPYLSVYLSPFLPFIQMFLFLYFFFFSPGIRAIRAAHSPRPWYYLPHDICTNAALFYHPHEQLFGKKQTCFSFQPPKVTRNGLIEGWEASVLDFNVLICFSSLCCNTEERDVCSPDALYMCRKCVKEDFCHCDHMFLC